MRNEYPEVSWDVLWGKVWYEGYDEPDYIWQSSASTNEFEPKLSLVPLTFGTIKAAFYAMLFAVPIALLGAIYAAQFMAPRMRQTVKPSIEIMEALPTVILGFLAGLWLAPLVEEQLAGVFRPARFCCRRGSCCVPGCGVTYRQDSISKAGKRLYWSRWSSS